MGWLDLLVTVGGTALDLFGQSKEADAQAEASQKNAARLTKEAEYQEYRTDVHLKDWEEYKEPETALKELEKGNKSLKYKIESLEATIDHMKKDMDTIYYKSRGWSE